jgi:hypothetical protein
MRMGTAVPRVTLDGNPTLSRGLYGPVPAMTTHNPAAQPAHVRFNRSLGKISGF